MKHSILVGSLILGIMAASEAGSVASQPNPRSADFYAWQGTLGMEANPIPEASVECTPEVGKWWNQVRESGLRLLQLSNRLDQALAEVAEAGIANPNMSVEQSHSLWEKTVSPIEKAIDERREEFRGVLKEGIDRQYKPPVMSAKVIVLSTERPRYTEEARKHGVQGQVTLRVVLESDGRVTIIQVVKGLGYGLDEQAIEAVRKTVFLPSIVEGRFRSKATGMAAEFNLR